MTKPVQLLSVFGVVVACAGVGGQAPPAPTSPSTGFDMSGYWTAAMHEDALERGAGPELGDYGGFPINEAARLFALSYNASRVTLRHHQCDGGRIARRDRRRHHRWHRNPGQRDREYKFRGAGSHG